MNTNFTNIFTCLLSLVNESNRKEILEMDFEGMSENEAQFGT